MLNLFQHPLARESMERVEEWPLKQVQGDGFDVSMAGKAFNPCTD
jgi:hypothetical protein